MITQVYEGTVGCSGIAQKRWSVPIYYIYYKYVVNCVSCHRPHPLAAFCCGYFIKVRIFLQPQRQAKGRQCSSAEFATILSAMLHSYSRKGDNTFFIRDKRNHLIKILPR